MPLRLMLKVMKATNITFELHDWYDTYHFPIITIVGKTKEEDRITSKDPKLIQIWRNVGLI